MHTELVVQQLIHDRRAELVRGARARTGVAPGWADAVGHLVADDGIGRHEDLVAGVVRRAWRAGAPRLLTAMLADRTLPAVVRERALGRVLVAIADPSRARRPSMTPPDPPGRVRTALWLPIFDGLADPITVARLSADAEEAGWDGVFVWDHLRWREPVVAVADPWITMAAIASATESLRFGPMVSPLARRRPAKVARRDGDARPVERRPAHARGRPRERSLRR